MRVSPFPRLRATLAGLLLAAAAPAADPPVGLSGALRTIRGVSREGARNEAAAGAWKTVVAVGPDALVPTLAAFDAADPFAANWLRTAVDAVVETARKEKRPLPVAALEAFVKDPKHDPAARRIAFELFAADAKEAAGKLLPSLIDDPSGDLRRDAIAARLKAFPPAGADDATKKAELRTLFAATRDKSQAEEVAKLLDAAGEKPDLTRHFGYVTEWLVAGPFDSPAGAGFGKPAPPETAADPAAKYEGQKGAKFGWTAARSDTTYGTVDLNAALGKHKDAAAYALAVLVAEKETPAEFRIASQNALEVFLNGKKVFERNEYHHGTRMDQHTARGVLRAGKNELLVKVLQNNQTESWALVWGFALRACDATGGRLPLTQVVTRDGTETTVTPGALKPAAKKEEAK